MASLVYDNVVAMSSVKCFHIHCVKISQQCSALAEAGRFSSFYQAHRFRDALHAELIEADEIWSFVGAKKKNARQPGHGNLWTYTAIDPDSKLMVAWAVGERGPVAAQRVMADLADRVAGRIQLTTDAHRSYLEAIRAAFGWRIDYAQLVKDFDKDGTSGICKRRMIGDPDMSRVSTSIVERANLGMRHRMRRFTRRTMGFSKKGGNHAHMVTSTFSSTTSSHRMAP